MSIPKILHQIWIGNVTPPTKFMNTWREKNPDFEYIKWNEQEIKNRNMKFECQNRIDEIEEIVGKVDIIRWEILYKYGGVFVDADSICIEPIDDILLNTKCFSGWEQEQVRKNLIAIGTMGFPPKHPLIKEIIEHIKNNEVSYAKTSNRAWKTVGPLLLSNIYFNSSHKDLTIFPSYYFLPVHYTGIEYNGHSKIYAYQEWGSTKKNYNEMNKIELPNKYILPKESVSIVIPSFNTKSKYIKECLDSIKNQIGHFNMEIVWINDGSDKLHTMLLKKQLEEFKKRTRFITVKYIENENNMGLGYSLNKGVIETSNDIILRMDSDDIMFNDRVQKQIKFMKENPDCILCGSQIQMFNVINNKKYYKGITNHPNLDLKTYLKTKNNWLMNHPTFCFRKQEIIKIGNYNNSIHSMCEDFELILRVLKEYGKIYNMSETLLYYRLHENQLTYHGGKEGSTYWREKRNKLIEKILL